MIFYFFITSSFWELTFKLLQISEELKSKVFCLISFLLLSFFPLCLLLFEKIKKVKQVRTALAVVVGFILCSYFSLVHITDNKIGSSDKVSSIILFGSKTSKYLPFNFLSEKEQLLLGGVVMSWLDQKFNGKFANEFLKSLEDTYDEMATDKSFHHLGSQLAYFYLDVLGLETDNLEILYYLPKKAKGEKQKIPVLLFFHGAFGNWKSYLWMWKKFADEHGFAIVSPTFGNGRWDLPQGRKNIKRTIAWIKKNNQLDLNNILIGGISNGGIGASLVINDYNDDLSTKGLILISPVLPDFVKSNAFVRNSKNMPLFIISGREDKRIAITKIEERVTFFRKEGLEVEFISMPDQDHYLILTKRDELVQNVGKWYLGNSQIK